jgi:hypothetical protein
MELFEHIKTPGPPVDTGFMQPQVLAQQESDPEKTLREMTLFEFRDRYGHVSPGDSQAWLELFILAEQLSGIKLAEVLQEVRGGGAVLVPSDQYGYTIRPVYGPGGWTSQFEYEAQRDKMKPYSKSIVVLLKRLRGVFP